jgi:2-phosphosulfolactate phosphatase
VIDVALYPDQVRDADVAVVIDQLRATTTATQALAAGYKAVLCAESIERALSLRGDGRVLAGERHCVMPPGFDQGNSPLEAAYLRGRGLVLATTNGAPAVIAAVRHAPRVLLGCLLNLDALARRLHGVASSESARLLLLCAGTDGEVALEDVYVAGRISGLLPGRRTDAARVAEAVARGYETPFAALEESADAAVLRQSDQAADIAYCSLESAVETVGAVRAMGEGVAYVCDVSAAGARQVELAAGGMVGL